MRLVAAEHLPNTLNSMVGTHLDTKTETGAVKECGYASRFGGGRG